MWGYTLEISSLKLYTEKLQICFHVGVHARLEEPENHSPTTKISVSRRTQPMILEHVSHVFSPRVEETQLRILSEEDEEDKKDSRAFYTLLYF